MARKLNKKATGKRIIDKAQSSRSMSIDADNFWKKITTIKDFLDACSFVRVEPIYYEN